MTKIENMLWLQGAYSDAARRTQNAKTPREANEWANRATHLLREMKHATQPIAR